MEFGFAISDDERWKFLGVPVVKSTPYKKLAQMPCGSHIKIWNSENNMKKQNKKHQNARFIDEKLKNKSLMFFFSCDLHDFKF